MSDAKFWHERWEKNEIGFHENKPNPFLVKHFGSLAPNKESRVFVPLCGKTLDIPWLLSNGYRVAGAELSKIAIEQLFAELRLEPAVTTLGALTRYSAKNIDIFVGDIFDLSRELLGPIDAIYDRAALVALPEKIRDRYTAHLMQITNKAPQFLICFEYDQSLQEGPPFSISAAEVQRHYSQSYNIASLASVPVPGGLKGKCPATETAWRLTKRS
jgi:thiopurine S-methyltransferase